MGSLGLCNLLQTPDLHSQGEGSHAQRRWREARLSLHVLPGHGKCCSCCPWGQLWFVRTNYFSASAKCLGPHGSQASVPVAATDPAMDGGGGGRRNADGVSHPRGPSMETHLVLYSIPHLPPLIIQLSLRLWTCSSITLQRWMQRPGRREYTLASPQQSASTWSPSELTPSCSAARSASLGTPEESQGVYQNTCRGRWALP